MSSKLVKFEWVVLDGKQRESAFAQLERKGEERLDSLNSLTQAFRPTAEADHRRLSTIHLVLSS